MEMGPFYGIPYEDKVELQKWLSTRFENDSDTIYENIESTLIKNRLTGSIVSYPLLVEDRIFTSKRLVIFDMGRIDTNRVSIIRLNLNFMIDYDKFMNEFGMR